jgi:hypothetical protein
MSMHPTSQWKSKAMKPDKARRGKDAFCQPQTGGQNKKFKHQPSDHSIHPSNVVKIAQRKSDFENVEAYAEQRHQP